MVGRVEIVLLAILLIVSLIATKVAVEAKSSKGIKEGKSVEIKDARLIEVNATDITNDMYAKKATRVGDTWYFDDATLTTPKVKYLHSEKAIRDNSSLELIGNVKMVSSDDSIYKANRAVYLLEKKIFYTIGKFRAIKDTNRVRGINFFTDRDRGYSRAEKIYAVYEKADK